jgi:hypothetical protein
LPRQHAMCCVLPLRSLLSQLQQGGCACQQQRA